jgi:hypothetical protein
MFRGSERIRLITMLGTLCILGMIIYRSISSGTTKPAADNRESGQIQADAEKQESAAADKSSAKQKPAEKETIAPGPTDEDSEEWAEAENEFQVLTDGALGIDKVEKSSFQRVFSWVEHQTFAELIKRAAKDVPLDGLMRTPNKFRGKLLQIDLNVRQAVPFEDRTLSDDKLYELHGFSEDSGAWLYYVIAPALPEGMPTGSNIDVRVRVAGYFLKLQGYLEAGAKPRSAPLKAPLLIGRVNQLAFSGEKTAPADNNWLYPAAAGFVLLSFIFTLAQFFARRKAKRHQAQLDQYKIERSRAGLDQDRAARDDTAILPEESRDDVEGFDFMK